MSAPTEEVGALPLVAQQVNIGIDTVKTIVLPTTAQLKKKGGLLTMMMSIEVNSARITWSGTPPTITNGVLFLAGLYCFRGQEFIAAMQIIDTAAGGIINYGFYLGATS